MKLKQLRDNFFDSQIGSKDEVIAFNLLGNYLANEVDSIIALIDAAKQLESELRARDLHENDQIPWAHVNNLMEAVKPFSEIPAAHQQE